MPVKILCTDKFEILTAVLLRALLSPPYLFTDGGTLWSKEALRYKLEGRKLEFSIILPAALWLWGGLSL
jgi:hypothetical protein